MSKMNKIIWFGYTISYGGVRALLIFILTLLTAEKEVAEFSVYYSFITMAVIFISSAIGTQLIKLHEYLNSSLLKDALIKCIAISFIISLTSLAYFYPLSIVTYIYLLLSILFIGINQVVRYILIFQKKPAIGLFYDVTALAAFLVICYAYQMNGLHFSSLGALCYAYTFATIVSYFLYHYLNKSKTMEVAKQKTAKLTNSYIFYVGLTGISTSIVFIYPLIGKSILSITEIAILGTAISVIGILSVFPRTYMNYFYTELVQAIRNKNKKIYDQINRKVMLIVILIIAGVTFPLIYYIKLILNQSHIDTIVYLVLPIICTLLMSQISLVLANTLLFIEKEKISFYSNIISLIVFILSFKVSSMYRESGVDIIQDASLALSLCYFIRWWFYSHIVNHYFKQDTRSTEKANSILVVYGEGGHRTQMNRLMNKIRIQMNKKVISISDYKLQEQWSEEHFVTKEFRNKHSALTSVVRLNHFHQLRSCFLIAKQHHVSVMITSGPGIALLPALYFKILYRTRIIYIETWSRFETSSLTGRLMYYIADIFLIQHESLKKFYPKAIYCGVL